MSGALRVFYGGSFDPVHNGHLAIAQAARDTLKANVCLLPAGAPPHKIGTHANGEQRVEMLELAVAGLPGITVDRRELHRAGPSYTVDTLAELRAELGPQTPLVWLIGADSLLQLHTWHRWEALFEFAHLVVVRRPGAGLDAQRLRAETPLVLANINGRWLPPEALSESSAGGFSLLTLPELRPESSTALRKRIASGGDWQTWVPPNVAAYIERFNLYGESADIMGDTLPSASP